MLATTPLPLLALTKMNQTTFNVTFAMTRAYVSDDATKELIISSNSSSAGNGCYGSAKLEVKLTGYFRIDKGLWFSRYLCDLSPLNYNVADQSSQCEIYNTVYRGTCCVCGSRLCWVSLVGEAELGGCFVFVSCFCDHCWLR